MPSRILVVRFGALGDVVLLTVLLRALRARFPSAPIDVVTKKSFAPLLELHPAVAEVIPLPSNGSVRHLAKILAGRGYDVQVDAHGSLRSRALRKLLRGRWHSVGKYRLGKLQNIWTSRATVLLPVAEQYIAAVSSLGVEPDGAPPDLHYDDHDRAVAANVMTGDYVVLAPGGQHATKRWTASHWRALAANLGQRGIPVVGMGLPHEASYLADTPAQNAYDLPIRSAVALVAGAQAVVANDSGMMHVATAVGVPVVAMYGPTHPRLGYGPYRAPSRTVGLSLRCRPCSVFGSARCPAGHHRCMRWMSSARVMEALEGFL